MRCVVAVSGGVDSVVLLDVLARHSSHELIVAHFDHGVRKDSAADSRFVEGLARKYGVTFEGAREELGQVASEALARDRRYAFLRGVAKKYEAHIVTAHHGDDVVETIAINLIRGSGWRGLAVMDAGDVSRPLLSMRKQDIYDYALKHSLEWVEDATNYSDRYLRNQVRRRLGSFDDQNKDELRRLRTKQVAVKRAIDHEARRVLGIREKTAVARHLFIMIEEREASELLRHVFMEKGISLTRPQRLYVLHMIKVAKAGKTCQPSGEVSVTFTERTFIVNHHL